MTFLSYGNLAQTLWVTAGFDAASSEARFWQINFFILPESFRSRGQVKCQVFLAFWTAG